jgi:hypothetical protein
MRAETVGAVASRAVNIAQASRAYFSVPERRKCTLGNSKRTPAFSSNTCSQCRNFRNRRSRLWAPSHNTRNRIALEFAFGRADNLWSARVVSNA